MSRDLFEDLPDVPNEASYELNELDESVDNVIPMIKSDLLSRITQQASKHLEYCSLTSILLFYSFFSSHPPSPLL